MIKMFPYEIKTVLTSIYKKRREFMIHLLVIFTNINRVLKLLNLFTAVDIYSLRHIYQVA